MPDQPRLFRDPQEISRRETEIDLPHVAPLNAWVRSLKTRLGPDAIVPWFDPQDGGCNAQILWLLEAPGPKATRERGGSGFISFNNNDRTAQNSYQTREEAGVPRNLVVAWNVIPFYIGTERKTRSFNPNDIAAGGPLLLELIQLLPNLKVVILGGKAAQKAWQDFAPRGNHLEVITCPHPSPRNLNTRPGNRDQIIAAWREALDYIGKNPPSITNSEQQITNNTKPMTSPLPTWTEPITARPSEIDFQNRWKPAAFFAAMQEAATHHAENLGFDFDEMIANNQVWLLARMRIRFLSFPQPGQALALTTWPRGVQQKIFFRREFQFLDEQDQPLALATSAWLLVDVNARRMLNPAALSGGLPLNEGLTALDEPLDKIALPAELPALAQRTAGYADVDMMGHVNNTRYVEWLTDLFPFEHHASRTLRWLQINYTNEVKPGARVELGAVESEAGVWLAAGTNLDTGQRAFEAALGWE